MALQNSETNTLPSKFLIVPKQIFLNYLTMDDLTPTYNFYKKN